MPAEATLDQLRKDVDTIRADIGALTETLRSATSTLADDAVRQMSNGAARANAAVRDGAKVVHETANKSIAEHPMVAVAVAFGLGIVLGKLLDRD